MEINNEKIDKAKVGDYIGMKVSDRVRPVTRYLRLLPSNGQV